MTPAQVLNTYEKQVIDTVKQGQDLVIQAVKSWADATKGFIPEIPGLPALPSLAGLPGLDALPAPGVLVDGAFAFADKLLAAQRDFVTAVLAATEPVRTK
jgi:hypothetical protein